MFKVYVVECRGSSFEVGVQQAKAFLNTPKGRGYLRRKKRRPPINAKNASVVLERYAPNILEELEGIASGLEQSLGKIIRDFSNSRLPYPNMGCSAIMKNGIYARNYDYNPTRYDRRLVALQPGGVNASLGFSHLITGRVDGLNEHGLAVGIHSVTQKVARPGLGPVLTARIILDQCRDTDDALYRLKHLPLGLGFNFSMVDANGKAVVVETVPNNIIVRKGEELVCTNHFQSKELAAYNRRNIGRSLRRVWPLENMLLKAENVSDLFSALNDSVSPAFHHLYNRSFGTLHTMVCSPKNREVMVGIGGDCSPTVLDFTSWVEGNDFEFNYVEGLLGGFSQPYGPGAAKFLAEKEEVGGKFIKQC